MSLEHPPKVESLETKREAVMEQAREGRANILSGVLERGIKAVQEKIPESVRNVAVKAVRFTPLGHIERTKTAITGKDAFGEKVSTQQRVLSGMVVCSAALMWGFAGYAAATGSMEAAAAGATTGTVTIPLNILQMGPHAFDAIKSGAASLGSPKLMALVSGIESIMKRAKPEDLEAAKALAQEQLEHAHA